MVGLIHLMSGILGNWRMMRINLGHLSMDTICLKSGSTMTSQRISYTSDTAPTVLLAIRMEMVTLTNQTMVGMISGA